MSSNNLPTIKHLVLSGGGPSMIQTLGALQHLEEDKFINLDKIETIYGTSAGAIIGVLLCLKFDWETLSDYIIKRPWHEVFPVKVQQIFDVYSKKGVFDEQTIIKCFRPVLYAKNIDINISLKDFFDYSKVELHFFTFEVNNYQEEDISYLTHPSLSLITAIHMSCAIPIIMTPVCIENKFYIDGGVNANYPLKWCLPNKKEEEVLGFKNKYIETNDDINSSSSLIAFITTFIFKLINSKSSEKMSPKIPYEVMLDDIHHLSVGYMKSTLYSIQVREELYKSGMESGIKFLKEQCSKTELECPSSV
jgi:predicted acylesterase/phospholipase RssA